MLKFSDREKERICEMLRDLNSDIVFKKSSRSERSEVFIRRSKHLKTYSFLLLKLHRHDRYRVRSVQGKPNCANAYHGEDSCPKEQLRQERDRPNTHTGQVCSTKSPISGLIHQLLLRLI